MTTLRRGRQRIRTEVGTTRALDRGLAVLEVLAEESPLPLAVIARRTGQSSSTAFRMLETLRQRGFAEQIEDTGLYRIGVKALEIGGGYMRSLEIGTAAAPFLRKLADATGETISLAISQGRDAVIVSQIDSPRSNAARYRVGARLPLHASALGKALLAWLWEEQIEARLGAAPYLKLARNTLTERDAVFNDLIAIRRRGYAFDDEECDIDFRGLAAPVFDQEGAVVGAIGLCCLANRLALSDRSRLASEVQEAAAGLTRRLGGQRPGDIAKANVPANDIFVD